MTKFSATRIEAMAETCINRMGDVFWNYQPARDGPLGHTDPHIVAKAAVATALREMWSELDSTAAYVSQLRDEYSTLVAGVGEQAEDDRLVAALVSDGDWTANTARDLLRLAQEYGFFVLRNALALAEALDIEDGSRRL